ncbi:hypothetical protein [Yersinia canariae]|uniref:hypothetical protein n=1 Tax=Yersinia canariae TaxID=2607663 RepID=UPI00216861A4|nr:hypothetical protein [Yersinia canariae]
MKSLFKEMTAQGIKFTPENIVSAAKDSSGKIIFLEKGSSKAGLQHIVEEHGSQFAQIGVSEARIPDVVMKAVTDGKIFGYQGTGTGRPIYETVINGKKYNIAVTVGNNGYIHLLLNATMRHLLGNQLIPRRCSIRNKKYASWIT